MPELSDSSRSILLRGGNVVTPSGLAAADVLVRDGRIAAIGETGSIDSTNVVDVDGLYVAPGYIDIQINGGFGHDFTQNPASIWDVGSRLPEYGVTTFLPTVITSPASSFAAAQQVMAEGMPAGYSGAVPLGLHLEGPMLSPHRSGTHDKAYLREPTDVNIDTWSPGSGVRMATLAPELPGALDVIGRLVKRGVTVSLGHSDANNDEAIAGIRSGATVGTHLYNAMSNFQHREPGLVGTLLDESAVSVEIIVDGIHSHPAAVRLAWRVKGPDQLVLITDAMAAMGMGHGQFIISSVDVKVDETGPRNASGVLAGSALTMDSAVRNLVAFTGCAPEQAIGAATKNPAQVIGETDRGTLAAGERADIVVLDEELNVKLTLADGETVHDTLG